MNILMIIGGLSGLELAVIVLVVLIFFGAGKLPMVFKQVGAGIRDFQKSLRGEDEDEDGTPPKELEDKSASNTQAPTSTKSEATS